MTRSVIANNGYLIKRKVEEMGLTQEQFADLVCIGERGFRKWLKSGIYDIRILCKVANIFNCSVEDLILYE